jgi:hypothetical protein
MISLLKSPAFRLANYMQNNKNGYKKIFHRIDRNANTMEKRRVVMKPSLKLSQTFQIEFFMEYFFA